MFFLRILYNPLNVNMKREWKVVGAKRGRWGVQINQSKTTMNTWAYFQEVKALHMSSFGLLEEEQMGEFT